MTKLSRNTFYVLVIWSFIFYLFIFQIYNENNEKFNNSHWTQVKDLYTCIERQYVYLFLKT